MNVEMITKADLQDFGEQLLVAMKEIFKANGNKKWLKTNDVTELLGISDVTLQTLRNNGTIPYSKIGNICYYNADELDEVMKSMKKVKGVG